MSHDKLEAFCFVDKLSNFFLNLIGHISYIRKSKEDAFYLFFCSGGSFYNFFFLPEEFSCLNFNESFWIAVFSEQCGYEVKFFLHQWPV